MLKRIPKSDISIRPFKAYKEWSFNKDSQEITLLYANDSIDTLNTLTDDVLYNSTFPQNSVFGQLRAQFYNGNEDNPFMRSGIKTNRYVSAKLSKERFLSGSATVISIPQIYVGEGMQKGSVVLLDNIGLSNQIEFIDDSFGNLFDQRDEIILRKIDVESRDINFIDLSDYIYSASLQDAIGDFDIMDRTMNIIYNGINEDINIVSVDIETGVLIADNLDFLPNESQGIKVGNIFYNQGLIVLTRDNLDKLKYDWSLDYKSTKTIYEHEYLLIANEDEFNISTNPSAVVNVGRETELHTDTDGKIKKVVTNPGVSYIRKKSILESGETLDYRFSSSIDNTLAGFEHYDLSGSVDTIGSFLAPFITTIGLYDDNCDLVAIAKLPQPIKSMPDLTVNFIVRFDT